MGWLIFITFLSLWLGSAFLLHRKPQASWIITIGGSFFISITLLSIGFFVYEKNLTTLLIINTITAILIYLDTQNLGFRSGLTKFTLVQNPTVLAVICFFVGVFVFPVFLYNRNKYVAELVKIGHIQKPNGTLFSWLSGIFKSAIDNIALGAVIFAVIGSIIYYVKNRDDIHDSKEIKMIKTGSLQGCQSKTIKQMVDGFLGDPKWSSGVISTSEAFVNIYGDMLLYNKKIKALVQFRIDKPNNTFVFQTFEMNDIPQDPIIAAGLIKKMCDSAR